jgi:tetratricopeptide (TPR) repeat protein
MNMKKKKGTAGNQVPVNEDSASSTLGKKKNKNQNPDGRERMSSGSSSNAGSACGGQNQRGSSSSNLTPATASPASGPISRSHLTKQSQPAATAASASRRMGSERRGHNAEAEDVPANSSFGRRLVTRLSGGATPDLSDDVVNTGQNNRLFHVRDRDEHMVTNGHNHDSEWISVTNHTNSMSNLSSDSSNNENRSDCTSPPLSQTSETVTRTVTGSSSQPKRTAVINNNNNTNNNNNNTNNQKQKQQQQQPLHQPSPVAAISPAPLPAPARTKPQMDREERVKSLAKQANFLIDEGMMLDDAEVIQIDKEKIADAIRLLDVAIKIDANDYRLFINRGYCYELLSDFKKALEDADEAVKLRPDWANCHFRRGRAQAGMREFPEAEKSFKRSLKFDAKISDEVMNELHELRQNACTNMGFPDVKAREAADQTNSVAAAIQFLVHSDDDQHENFPDTGFPIRSGSFSSSSSLTRIAPADTVRSSASSSPFTPSATTAACMLWPSSEMTPALTHVRDKSYTPFYSRSSSTSNGSMMKNETIAAAAAAAAEAVLSEMNGSSKHAADKVVRAMSRLSGDERDNERDNQVPSSSSLSSKRLSQKEILVESVITNRQLFTFCPDLETRNEFGWFALWIGNISPTCSNDLLREMFCIFGDLVHYKVYPSDDVNDVSYALVHYDNDKSPIHAMAEYQV